MESSAMVIRKHRETILPSPDKHPSPFSRIPFSWEHLPGIPKQPSPNNIINNVSSKLQLSDLLPLPPAASTLSSSSIKQRKKKFNTSNSSKLLKVPKYKKDPFVAALAECSKDVDDQDTRGKFWDVAKVTRNISGNISCRRSCAISVSESIMYLPRSRSERKIHWV